MTRRGTFRTGGEGPRIGLPAGPLRTGETALRPWRADDEAALVELCQDPEIVRWIRIPAVYGPDEAREYISTRAPLARSGAAASFAVLDAAAGDTPIGAISLLRFAWADRRAEVGYWLGAAARGRGHASRAVALLTEWGFRTLGLERIELVAAVANLASRAVAVRTGFTEEARLRAYDTGPDGPVDMIWFGRLPSDPPPPPR